MSVTRLLVRPNIAVRGLIALIALIALAAGTVDQAAAATIGVGDIVVLAVAADNTNDFSSDDGFSWAPLIDLDAGDEIFFTDSSWNIQVPGDFNGLEGLIRYTAPPGGVAAGTIFLVDLQSLPAGHATLGSVETGSEDPVQLPTFGDQIAVFTGSATTPTFVFAVNTDQSVWSGSSGSSSSSRSDLYPGLTDGENAVAVGAGPMPGAEFDNAYYSGPTTRADKATWLARVSDRRNWTGEDLGTLVTELDMTAGLGDGGLLPVGCSDPVESFLSVSRAALGVRRGVVSFNFLAVLDVGEGALDFASTPTTITVGGDTTIVVPAGGLVETSPRSGRFVYKANGVSVSLVPHRSPSRYRLRVSERSSAQPGTDGLLAFGVSHGAVSASSRVKLSGGRFRGRLEALEVTAPPLALRLFRGSESVPGVGRFKLSLSMPRDGSGVVPPLPATGLLVCAGDFAQLIPAADLELTARGYRFYDRDVAHGLASGIRRVRIDTCRGWMTVDGTGVSLGTFADGDPIEVGFGIDGDDNAVKVLVNSPSAGVVLY